MKKMAEALFDNDWLDRNLTKIFTFFLVAGTTLYWAFLLWPLIFHLLGLTGIWWATVIFWAAMLFGAAFLIPQDLFWFWRAGEIHGGPAPFKGGAYSFRQDGETCPTLRMVRPWKNLLFFYACGWGFFTLIIYLLIKGWEWGEDMP